MSNSSGDWAVEATPAERIAQLQSDVKRLKEEVEWLRGALRKIRSDATHALDCPENRRKTVRL